MSLDWGDKNKEEAKKFLTELVRYSNNYYDPIPGLDCTWNDTDNNDSKLIVKATLRQFMELLKYDKLPQNELDYRKDNLSRIIHRLIKELKFIENNIPKPTQQGTETRHFTVNVPNRSVDKLLSRLEEKWESKRPPKSKALSSWSKEANDTARSSDAIIQPNPFSDTGQISNPARFSGRKELLRQLFEDLSQGCSRSLVGEAQVGKSSILQMICKLGPERLDLPPKTFIYLDMSHAYNEQDFLDGLCDTLGIQCCRGMALNRALHGKRYILCLDEIDNMARAEHFTGDERTQLRALADGADRPLTLVTASQKPLRDLFPDSPSRTSPLADICRQIDVKPFTWNEARQFLIDRLKGTDVSFSPCQIEELLKKSSCHPARLQQLAAELYRDLQINLR